MYTEHIASGTTPLLTINLFGELTVLRNDQQLDCPEFKRHKIQTLLAMLVLNRGKGLTMRTIQELLWNDGGIGDYRNNFYCIWSLLRKALALPDNSCPYLIKSNQCYKLDMRYVRSDVFELEAIVEKLTFDQIEVKDVPEAYVRLNSIYAGEFVPGDPDHPMFVRYRQECQELIVEALIHSADRLVEVEAYTPALALARKALQYSTLREDAFKLIFLSFIGQGCRASAIDTYFAYKEVMANEFGIEPSKDMQELYENYILNDSA